MSDYWVAGKLGMCCVLGAVCLQQPLCCSPLDRVSVDAFGMHCHQKEQHLQRWWPCRHLHSQHIVALHHCCCCCLCVFVLCYRELCAAAANGPGLADMFARIMVSVDEDIISLEIPR